jgi:hypothetical protein
VVGAVACVLQGDSLTLDLSAEFVCALSAFLVCRYRGLVRSQETSLCFSDPVQPWVVVHLPRARR